MVDGNVKQFNDCTITAIWNNYKNIHKLPTNALVLETRAITLNSKYDKNLSLNDCLKLIGLSEPKGTVTVIIEYATQGIVYRYAKSKWKVHGKTMGYD